MEKIKIVTDSCCDIPKYLIDRNDITVLNLDYIFDDGSKCETLKEFYDMMISAKQSKTSAVNIAQAEDFFEQEAKQGNCVIAITFASTLSSTYQNIVIASDMVKETYSNANFNIIDSMTGTGAQGLMVLKACQMRDRGATVEEIVSYLEKNKSKFKILFAVDDIEYLKRGGRISPAKAAFASTMNIKPILTITPEGEIISVGKAIGKGQAMKYIDRILKKELDDIDYSLVASLHSNDKIAARKLTQVLSLEEKFVDTIEMEMGTVIGSHVGPGGCGIVYKKK